MIHLRSVNDNLHEARADIEKLKNHLASVSDKAFDYVDDFIDLKNKNKIKGSESDIYYWLKKDPQELIKFIEEKINSVTNTQSKKHLKVSGSRFVCSNDYWNIYAILNHDACKIYGKNTKWCITEQSDYYWRKYLLQNYRFYFAIKKIPNFDSFDKVALQCKGKKIVNVWDSTDTCYKIEDVKFLNLPDISDELKITSKDRKIANGLTQTSNNILKVSKSNLDDNVFIPKSIAAIPNEGFSKSNIKSIEFEDNSIMKTLNSGLFFNCINLETVDLPEGLEVLNRGSFHSCINLDTINLPKSLKAIGPFCFTDCENLDSITIPHNVKFIDEGAFKGCDNLISIKILSDDIQIDATAFDDCPKITIYGSEASNAHDFADSNNITFKALSVNLRS